MEKILVLGDPHFRETIVHLMEPICKEILELIVREQITRVISLGDTLHDHAWMHQETHDQACEFYIQVSKLCPLVVLIGNHDMINVNMFLSDKSPFKLLKNIPNITIVDKPLFIGPDLFTPFVQAGRLREALATVDYYPRDKGQDITDIYQVHPRFIFSHQTYINCLIGNRKCIEGDYWDTSLPQVINGHHHAFQVLPKVINVGSLIQTAYGEDHDKAVMIIQPDMEDTSVGFKDSCMFRRYRLKTVPRKKIIHMNIQDVVNKTPWESLEPDVLHKVVIHCSPTESSGLRKRKEYKVLQERVDKVEIHPDLKLPSKVEEIIRGIQSAEGKFPLLEDVVIKMLEQDAYTLKLFKNIYQSTITV